MATKRRIQARGAIWVAAAFALCGLLAAEARAVDATLCCFSNWRFAGTCIEQVPAGQSCSAVLGTLNNPMSAGTTYCGGTTIRGGWAAVACGGGASSGGTATPDLVAPVKPSYPPLSQPPQVVSPEATTGGSPRVRSQRPTFVTPVDPAKAPEAAGPSLISL